MLGEEVPEDPTPKQIFENFIAFGERTKLSLWDSTATNDHDEFRSKQFLNTHIFIIAFSHGNFTSF